MECFTLSVPSRYRFDPAQEYCEWRDCKDCLHMIMTQNVEGGQKLT